jgi:hypothetical protein
MKVVAQAWQKPGRFWPTIIDSLDQLLDFADLEKARQGEYVALTEEEDRFRIDTDIYFDELEE